jgi:transposase
MRAYQAQDLIFIDEMGVNLSLIRHYARSLRGTRARGSQPNRRGQNVSVLGAISLQKVVTSINLVGGIDGLTFEAFIIQKLVPELWTGAVVLLDNHSIHKGKNIEKAIQEAGAELIYLPPYSPDFSPIENFWSKVKSRLRTWRPRTYRALEDALVEAYTQVSQQDFHNWFTHGCYCISSN